MRIGIDARMIEHSGIGTYLRNLIKSIIKLNPPHEFVLFGDSGKLQQYGLKVIHDTTPIYSLSEQVVLFLKFVKEKLDILHIPHYPVPLFYTGKIVVTIHDIIHLLFPKSAIANLYAKFMFRMVVSKSQKIIAVSENTKNDIINKFKVNSDKIKVIHQGVGDEFQLITDSILKENFRRKYSINDRFVLYVGLMKPHKNIITLIRAFSNVVKKSNIKLLLVGNSKSNYAKKIIKEIRNLQLEKDIRLIENLPTDELVILYNLADVLVLPSLYEGFGLPPLEAMACGCPVITSNSASLPEVVGDAAIMVKPCDVEELSKRIYDVLTDKELRQELVRKGLERARQFSWEKTARETLKVFEEVIRS